MIINIDEALKLRTEYNILREPLNDMMKNQQEQIMEMEIINIGLGVVEQN